MNLRQVTQRCQQITAALDPDTLTVVPEVLNPNLSVVHIDAKEPDDLVALLPVIRQFVLDSARIDWVAGRPTLNVIVRE